MYRSSKPSLGPPSRPPPLPFGRPPLHGLPFGFGPHSGIPPPGHLPPTPCGLFPSPAPSFHHNRPPIGEHFISPPCNSFSTDHRSVNAVGSSQQIIPPPKPPHPQIPQWNPTLVKHQPLDTSDKAGEEFLRCIAANEPLPDYLKGDMAHNMADALKSARDLKEAVKSDPEFQRHVSKSRSRSRGRSRGRSRAKSRGRSRSTGRSKSRPRSKSRGRPRSKSRGRPRSKSRGRDRSRSKKQHRLRSKSRARKSKSRSCSSDKKYAKDKKRKRSPSPSCSDANGSPDITGKSLLEELRIFMSSKELEERLPTLKEAILHIKATDANQELGSPAREQKPDSLGNLSSLDNDNDSILLPHERVGGDFSWLQGQCQEDPAAPKADESEDEELFLYGNDDSVGGKSITTSTQFQRISSSLAYTNLDCKKIKNILRTVGSTDSSNLMKQQHPICPQLPSPDLAEVGLALPALKNPNVRQALESLQSLIKERRDMRAKCDDGANDEQRQKEKRARINKMDFLMKELEALLEQEGLNFLTPVIGFYCQKCETFIEDLNSAENHAANHCHGNSTSMSTSVLSKKPHEGVHAGNSKGQSHHYSSCGKQHQHTQDMKDGKDYSYCSVDHRSDREYQSDRKDDRDHTSKHDSEHSSHRSGQETLSIQEEMRKERMLITVSCGLTPPPNTRIKEGDMKKELKDHKISTTRERDKVNRESSDSSDDHQGKTKSKSHKKKKKKKEKKKKKGNKS